MSFNITWSRAALDALYRIHWRTAGDVDAAVLATAAKMSRRSGPVRGRYRIRVAGYDVLFYADREVGDMFVVALYRVW